MASISREQRERHNATRRAKYAADPVERARRVERATAWRVENPERKREANRKWEVANPERAAENKARWKHANLEKVRKAEKERYLDEREQRLAELRQRRTGFSPQLMVSTLRVQGHCCAICKVDLRSLPTRSIHADHCHTTEKPRGVLCHWCNVALGAFKDDPERLRAAIEYLEDPPVNKGNRFGG